MRLHRLTLSAFGPFAGTETVDFDALSAAGLFLLHGPTGAGKTSVLDGVCYALYGQVPGARPATRLRSDHAAPGAATEVVLELTLAGRRLEITRRPEQRRAKRRGTGTTIDKAVTLLRERGRDGAWQGLSTSHQEIGEEVRRLVGMSCEQFCQVVLLPQGEFATFLRASATERAVLLGKLFDTRRFKAVEDRLKERKSEAARRLQAGEDELRELAARMRQEAGARDEAEPAQGEFGLGWAAVLRCDARERSTVARTAVVAAEEARAAAAQAATAARDLYGLQVRRRRALERAAAVALDEPARTRTRTAVTRAQRAAALTPALTLRAAAAAAYGQAEVRAEKALAELGDDRPSAAAGGDGHTAGVHGATVPPQPVGDAERVRAGGRPAAESGLASAPRPSTHAPGTGGERAPDSAASDRPRSVPVARRTVDGAYGAGSGGGAGPAASDPAGSVPAGRRTVDAHDAGPADGAGPGAAGPVGVDGELARRAGELRVELGGLAAAGEAEVHAAEASRRRAALGADDREDEAEAREARDWLDRWPSLRGELQSRVDAGVEGAAEAARLAADVAAARQRAEAAAERDRLVRESVHAEDDVRDARDRTATAREAWQDLREARIAGIAAELAAQLADGEPCRVCGACEHPAPARAAGSQVTRAAEDSAYADFQRHDAQYGRARDAAARVHAALDAARALAGDAAQAELAAAHAASAAEHAAAARRADGLAAARAASARAEAERDRRAATLADAVARTAARTSRREELDGQIAQSAAALDKARAGHPSVEARRRSLEARIARLDRAVQAVRDRSEAAARLADAETALRQAAVRAGFGTADEAAAALLPANRLWEAERRVEEWAKEEAALEAELAEPEPAAAAELPPADPQAAHAELDTVQRRLSAAEAAASAAAGRCAELDRLSALMTARTRELAPAQQEFATVRRLSDLVSATTPENAYRMELETYVLAARLEQVAAAAGVRLQHMSGGRYTLVHTDARSSGRGKSGLGLRVVDAWTGTERDTATLSGGETFFASLALALGLADVVTGEAGGARLDTLFVDEGFGSLDEQALDEVLDVLDGLRERDRAVGIVSHVADLRHRIPARLHVDKRRNGSVVRLRGAAHMTSGLRSSGEE